jgi:hypothetical protein
MEAHYIIMLRDGRIIERGTYEQVQAMKGEISHLIKTASNNENDGDNASESLSTESLTIYEDATPEDVEEQQEAEESVGHLAPIKPGSGRPMRKDSHITLRRASTVSFHGPRGKLSDEEDNKVTIRNIDEGIPSLTNTQAAIKTKQTKEFSEQGRVKKDIYIEYAKASNLGAVCVYLVMLLGAQSAQIGMYHKYCTSCLAVTFIFRRCSAVVTVSQANMHR